MEISEFDIVTLPYGRLQPPAADSVDIWLLPLQDLAPPLTRSLNQDANPETEAAQRLTRKMMLRLLLAAYLQRPAREIRLAQGAAGKPFISQPGDSGLHFSQTHCLDYVMIAIGGRERLGIDMEPISRLVSDPLAVARRYFARAEYEYLATIEHPSRRREAFLRLWTRKEAVVKATGGGIVSGLHRFTVDDRTRPPRVSACDDGNASDWHLLHLEPSPGLIGTLASDHPLTTVNAYRVSPPLAPVTQISERKRQP
ncbi:MAG: 4'-phosphopantetheinyl transferase superfamily protein [Wenzhouxiangellaceae bacterium]